MKVEYIICENKAERDAVFRKLEKNGYIWANGRSLTEWTMEDTWKDEPISLNLDKEQMVRWAFTRTDHRKHPRAVSAQHYLYNHRPILITRKGRIVTAEDKNTGEKAIATCSPDDTFDFGTGAMIAVARLIAKSDKDITKDAEMVLRQLLGDDVNSDAPAEEEPTTKFKVGDLVTLKNGLEPGKTYGNMTLYHGNMFDSLNGKPEKVIRVLERSVSSPTYQTESGWYYSEEMLEAWDESKIREGDIVRVVSTGKTFDTYFEWVARNVEEKNLIARFKCDSLPPIVNNYEVVKIAPHGACSELLAYIKSTATNRCYVVGVGGLEKVTE